MRRILLGLTGMVGLWAGVAWAQPAPKSPPPPHFPWADEAPPVLAGVHLGESRHDVLAALGRPDMPVATPATPGQFLLTYKARGVSVSGSVKTGVFAITLTSAGGGGLGVLHVGDNLPDMLRAWGRPRTVNGPYGIYDGKGFLAIVQFDPGSMLITHLGIAAKAPS